MTTDRNEAIQSFLADAGWGNATSAPLAGDASNRRYLRLSLNGAPGVLMDAPPAKGEDCRPFVAMTQWLRQLGLSAPEVLAMDLDQGFLLLEDLGDDLFARHIPRVGDETELYTQAVNLLIRLADTPPPDIIGTGSAMITLPPYDQTTLIREAALLTDWWMPLVLGKPTPKDLAAEYGDLVRTATKDVAPARDVVVLRDYHAENLLWMPDRDGLTQVGLLDYQDALAGHAAYDLVSLLEDARRGTSEELQATMLQHYLDQRPSIDADGFRQAYCVLGAQRNMKIIGIFARLAQRDGKPGYLKLIPRVWGHLIRDLDHPVLANLKAWVDSNVPPPTSQTIAIAEKATS